MRCKAKNGAPGQVVTVHRYQPASATINYIKRFSALLLGCGFMLMGCDTSRTLLNPGRLDEDYSYHDSKGLNKRTAPADIQIYTGTFPKLDDGFDAPKKRTMEDATFAGAWRLAAKDANEGKATPAARIMLARGIAVSDRLCAAWFRKLSEAQANASLSTDLAANTGALAGAIMGFTNTAAPVIGAAAAATGFIQNEINSFQTNIIVAPDVGLIQELVNLRRKDKATTLLTNAKITYEEALTGLTDYDNDCTHAAVKRLVNQSISKNAAQSSAYSSNVLQLAIAALQSKSLLGPDAKLTNDDVVNIYGFLFKPTKDPYVKALSAPRSPPLTTDKLITPPTLQDAKGTSLSKDKMQVIQSLLEAPATKAVLEDAVVKQSTGAASAK